MNNITFLNIKFDKEFLIEQKNNLENLDITIADLKSGYKIGKIKDKSVMTPIIKLLPVPPSGMYFFINPPKSAHIDRGRTCAINFPLDVPGKVFAAKQYPSDWFSKNMTKVKRDVSVLSFKEDIINYPSYESNQDKYDIGESIDKAYLLNASVPHGVIHDRNHERYVFTCSYTDIEYNELKKQIKDIIE